MNETISSADMTGQIISRCKITEKLGEGTGNAGETGAGKGLTATESAGGEGLAVSADD